MGGPCFWPPVHAASSWQKRGPPHLRKIKGKFSSGWFQTSEKNHRSFKGFTMFFKDISFFVFKIEIRLLLLNIFFLSFLFFLVENRKMLLKIIAVLVMFFQCFKKNENCSQIIVMSTFNILILFFTCNLVQFVTSKYDLGWTYDCKYIVEAWGFLG